MLYAVAHPSALFGLILGFLAGVVVHGVFAAYAARWLGDRVPVASGFGRPDLRRHVDAFGAVAALLGGVGWGPAIAGDGRRFWRPGRFIVAALAGPVGNFLLAALAFLGYVGVGGTPLNLGLLDLSSAVHGSIVGLPFAQLTLLLFAMENLAMGFLSFIPLPPLEGAAVLFRLAPRSRGWQLAEYRLAEQNWGVGILLVLLILPLYGGEPLLIALLNAIIHPILSAAAGW